MKLLYSSALLAAFAVSGSGALPSVTPEERARIEAAVPREAVVKPAKPRRLLICTLNVGYPGHPSIMHANAALKLMGERTGAFEAIVSDDPNMFRRESLKNFDAVFFNNTVGNLFTDRELRRDLLEFVTGGGGVLGVHGASIAFAEWPGAIEDWPEWGHVLGARGSTHKSAEEPVTVKLDDPTHPLTRVFGGDFEYADEFFRFFEPYSRDRVRVLLSIDTTKTDFARDPKAYGNVIRPDNDYPLSWVRNYGRGRIFYSTIAHQPRVFWDAKMLQFLLGAVQFAVGDYDVPTTPSSKLTPAMRAQEKLGWKLGLEAWTFNKYTYFEAIEKTAQLGLPYIGGLNVVTVSKDIPKPFDPSLSDDELARIRLKLDEHGLRLITYFIHDIPAEEAFCRRLFEFARKMGIDTIIGEPKPEALDLIEKFANEYSINVAIHNHAPNLSPEYWQPEGVLKTIQHRSRRIGACPDIGYWIRSGIDPIAGIRLLGDRIMAVQMHDLQTTGKDAHDVPWGTGVAKTGELLRELQRLGIKPRMIGLEYSHDWSDSMPEIAESIEFYNQTILQLATLRNPTMAEPSAPPSPPADLDSAFVALRSYDRGSPRAALLPLDAAVAAATADVSDRRAMERQLITALQEGGSVVRREYICSKLKLVGSDASVKPVAALLLMPELVTAARDVLQAIPGDESTQALRAAVPRADGPGKVAIIQSLGLRRDEGSVGTLRKLLEGPAEPVTSAAAAALGEIGTIEAADALRAFHRRAPAALRTAAADACLVCAEKLVAAGLKSDAAALYQLLATDAHPKHVQYAAQKGLSQTRLDVLVGRISLRRPVQTACTAPRKSLGTKRGCACP